MKFQEERSKKTSPTKLHALRNQKKRKRKGQAQSNNAIIGLTHNQTFWLKENSVLNKSNNHQNIKFGVGFVWNCSTRFCINMKYFRKYLLFESWRIFLQYLDWLLLYQHLYWTVVKWFQSKLNLTPYYSLNENIKEH